MAKKGSMDEEALAIQRASREIEKLDDESAQARVALYIYLRYTAAGDHLAPGGAQPPRRIEEGTWRPAPTTALAGDSAARTAVSGPAAAAASDGAGDASAAADGDSGGASDAPGQTGWNLSSEGSESDDDEEDVKPKEVDTSDIPNADGEAEVEI